MTDPFLRRARLAYWLAWLPMIGLLAALWLAVGAMGPLQAVASALVLGAGYALICRSTWYMCRALPLGRTAAVQLVASHGGAALLAAGLWVGLARLAALGLPADWAAALIAQQVLLFGLGVAYFLLAVAYHYTALGLDAARRAEQRDAASRELAREAELRALRAQLDPHFLFNSLNAIAALTGAAPERARRMCLELSGFLRETLRLGERRRVSLGAELELVRRYLAVEKVRLGERLTVEEQVDRRCLACAVPPLLLQPAVENAVRHGVAGLPEGGWLRLAVDCAGDRLCIALSNPYDPEAGSSGGLGRGTRLVRERLQAEFGAAAELRQTRDAAVWRLELRLPQREVDEPA